MSNNQFLDVIRVWAALVWADDVIADAEKVAMVRLIKTAALSDEERRTALGFLEHKVELDAGELVGLSSDSRLGIYRAAARLAAVDRDVAVAEKKFLSRLRTALDIDATAAREIEEQIPGLGA